MRITIAAIAAALAMAGTRAEAQVAVPNFELERLWLDPAAVGSLVVGTGEIVGPTSPRLSLAAHWEHQPLVVTEDGARGWGLGAPGSRQADVVANRVTFHLGAAVPLGERLQLAVRLPVIAWQDGDAIAGRGPLPAAGVGTPTLGLTWKLVQQGDGAPVNMAVGLDALAPWGSGQALAGNPQWYFAPRLEAGRRFDGFVIGAQAGLLVRERELSFGQATMSTEVQGGAVIATTGAPLRGELSVRGSYADFDIVRHMEVLAGARYQAGPWELFALAGPGFFEAPGSPVFRGLVGVALTGAPAAPKPPPPAPPPVVDPCAPGQTHTPEQCPALDDDGDGVINSADACPTVAGLAELKGCPAKDGDGDGIADHLDRCPEVAGLAELKGCPAKDGDGDGIADHLDKCPDVAGVAEAQGCPPPKAKLNLETRKIEILEIVYFDTNKATIQQRSYPLLDEVARIVRENPSLKKVVVEGHTDSTGKADYNLRLSGERARAVMGYLVDQGVNPGRLEAKGYGQTRPVGDNATRAGREQNRRVEFTIE
jgi:outer membrane protein OmpA-like peptidoglycan-associated protein